MKKLFGCLFTLICLLVACQPKQIDSKQALTDSLRKDSLILKIGYLPTLDALPFLVAQEEGLFDSLQIKVRMVRYEAGMDLDTAFQNKRVQGMVSDLCRSILQNSANEEVKVIGKTDGIYALVTARKLRLRQIKNLKERMVAIARNEVSDFLLDKLLEKNKLGEDEVNRPQINAIPLRQYMVEKEELDAALVPEPYATKAAMNGDRILLTNDSLNSQQGCIAFMFKTIVDKEEEIRKIAIAYNTATNRINQDKKGIYKKLIQKSFNLTKEVADTLTLPSYEIMSMPRQRDIEEAADWLKKRRLIPAPYKANRLSDSRFILK